ELEKKNEEIIERDREIKQKELINAQLRRELKDEKVKVREVHKKIEAISDAIILKHPDLAPPEKKYESTMHCLEDLTCILTMEMKPLALESVEEVMVHQKKEEKLKTREILTRYSELLALVKTMVQMAEV
ncbi:hypothetical protein KI387_040690, partial [Taxus chinensis]